MVQVRGDVVDDAVADFGVGEAGHGVGTSARFAESVFDDVGGADFFRRASGTLKKLNRLFLGGKWYVRLRLEFMSAVSCSCLGGSDGFVSIQEEVLSDPEGTI
jgi:hypothetical protein